MTVGMRDVNMQMVSVVTELIPSSDFQAWINKYLRAVELAHMYFIELSLFKE